MSKVKKLTDGEEEGGGGGGEKEGKGESLAIIIQLSFLKSLMSKYIFFIKHTFRPFIVITTSQWTVRDSIQHYR